MKSSLLLLFSSILSVTIFYFSICSGASSAQNNNTLKDSDSQQQTSSTPCKREEFMRLRRELAAATNLIDLNRAYNNLEAFLTDCPEMRDWAPTSGQAPLIIFPDTNTENSSEPGE